MRDDRIRAVYDVRIVAALIKHADIHAEERGQKDRPLRRPLVRGDKHHMLTVDAEVLIFRKEGLRKLERRGDILHAHERHDILDAGVVRVEGEQAVHPHRLQLAQHDRAVEGFPRGFAVLPPLVQEGHDDGDALRLPVAGRDDALEILVVIVRRHAVCLPVHLICERPVAYIQKDKHIPVTDRLLQDAFSLPA